MNRQLGTMMGLFVLAQLIPSTSSAAIPLQNQCSTTYDASRSYCVPVEQTEWRWYIDLHYGVPLKGPYASESEVLAVPPEWFAGSSWCSVTFNHMVYDSQAPVSQYGIDLVRSHTGIPPIFLTPKIGGMMIAEVSDGEAKFHAGVQARGGQAGA